MLLLELVSNICSSGRVLYHQLKIIEGGGGGGGGGDSIKDTEILSCCKTFRLMITIQKVGVRRCHRSDFLNEVISKNAVFHFYIGSPPHGPVIGRS